MSVPSSTKPSYFLTPPLTPHQLKLEFLLWLDSTTGLLTRWISSTQKDAAKADVTRNTRVLSVFFARPPPSSLEQLISWLSTGSPKSSMLIPKAATLNFARKPSPIYPTAQNPSCYSFPSLKNFQRYTLTSSKSLSPKSSETFTTATWHTSQMTSNSSTVMAQMDRGLTFLVLPSITSLSNC